jgi:hypothetical protein
VLRGYLRAEGVVPAYTDAPFRNLRVKKLGGFPDRSSYSHHIAADLLLCVSRLDCGPLPSAICPCSQGFQGSCGPRTGARTTTDRTGGSGYPDRPRGFLPLTGHFRLMAPVDPGGSPQSYLSMIAANLIRDHWRKSGGSGGPFAA